MTGSALNHFLRLARRGQWPASSGGEHRANNLAKCLIENLPGLDSLAIEGMCDFIEICITQPTVARDLLEGTHAD